MFWTNREDSRSQAELEDAAGALLKGCQQHYRSQVTRVKKISGVIDPAKADNFQSRALALLLVLDMDTFKQKVASLLRDYPKTKPWLEWWLRDSHAQMLFPPFQKMKTGLFQAMPDSTNAEEAMHAKLYATVGKRYNLMEGLLCLQVFMESFQLRAAGRSGMLYIVSVNLILNTPCFHQWVLQFAMEQPRAGKPIYKYMVVLIQKEHHDHIGPSPEKTMDALLIPRDSF